MVRVNERDMEPQARTAVMENHPWFTVICLKTLFSILPCIYSTCNGQKKHNRFWIEQVFLFLAGYTTQTYFIAFSHFSDFFKWQLACNGTTGSFVLLQVLVLQVEWNPGCFIYFEKLGQPNLRSFQLTGDAGIPQLYTFHSPRLLFQWSELSDPWRSQIFWGSP